MNHAVGHFLSLGYRDFLRAPQLHYSLVLILFFLFSGPDTRLFAQDLDDLLKTANEYFEKEQYHTAAQYYQVAIGIQDEDPSISYRLAESYRSIFDYTMAAHYYQQTIELDEVNYPVSPFYLAQMQKSMGNFKQAKDGFEHFLKTNRNSSFIPKNEKDNFFKQAEVEMEGCLWAIDQLGKSWREIGFGILPEPVNSASNDYAAVVAGDQTVITITSGRRGVRGGLVDNRFGEYFTDNFRYKFQGDDTWTLENSTDHFERTNTKFSDGVGTYSASGDKYYFTSCYEGSAYCKLYVTYKENGNWRNPELLNENVNAPGYDNKHPTLTKSGDTLVFVSNRPGGQGGNDLWYSVSKIGEDWGAPSPLPGSINTPFNEASPYHHKDNVLFFSSEGQVGMGGMDIFMAEGYFTSEAKIQNLGTPFNSGFDDSFFSMGMGKGFLSSNRPFGTGKFDIYSFNLPSKNANIAEFLEDATVGTQLHSRIRNTNGSNLNSARDEDQFYYDNLSAEERARLERILTQKQSSAGEFDPNQLSRDDYKYYNKLDISTKATIERLAHRRALELEGLASGGQMNPQEKIDWEFYHNIDDADKDVIDRIINVRVAGRRNAMALLSTEEQLYSTNSINQERIESKVHLKSLSSMEESLNERHQAGIKKFNQNQREYITDDNRPEISEELMQSKTASYFSLVESLGIEHQVHYQALSPEERDNVHHSAVHHFIKNSNQLSQEDRRELMMVLGIDKDPLIVSSSPQFQMSLNIREALVSEFSNSKALEFDQHPDKQRQALENQLVLELGVQQKMLQDQLELLSLKAEDARSLQQQLRQIISEQEESSDPELEQKIVEQFYIQSVNSLPLLSPKESYYFNALNPGHQLRLARLARMIDSQTTELATATSSKRDFINDVAPTDQWYYQELDNQNKEIVNQLVAQGWAPNVPYENQKLDFINDLTLLERERINRMMNGENLNLEALSQQQLTLTVKEEEPSEDQNTFAQSQSSSPSIEPFDQPIPSLGEVTYPGDQIYFDFDSHTLRSEARKALSEMVQFLKQQNKRVRILIEGHTDNVGSIKYNNLLGMRRSLSAAKYLKTSSEYIEVETKSHGESQPKNANETPLDRQMSRRVELSIQGVPYQSDLITYLVRPKVTMDMIVNATEIEKPQIIEWNGLDGTSLKAYQPLRLPASLNYQKIREYLYYPQPYQAVAERGRFHTVMAGENLYRLAQKYQTSVQVLEDLNGLRSSDLLSGQKLRVR